MTHFTWQTGASFMSRAVSGLPHACSRDQRLCGLFDVLHAAKIKGFVVCLMSRHYTADLTTQALDFAYIDVVTDVTAPLL